ncbi:hypothetical protein PCASD_25728 [Puccinia coronata f. sp. avenae]|uniref:4a-hydroxytetrahydrobiopterin dehydratase n=1 Tax=Puccinia coronata f. sp. avenae TaxID=200324 RepID=A0A2N5TJW5_9BASI|nr:hypothetical protein PCASD_25728 [Puccinia coronata f. sp. avenae]
MSKWPKEGQEQPTTDQYVVTSLAKSQQEVVEQTQLQMNSLPLNPAKAAIKASQETGNCGQWANEARRLSTELETARTKREQRKNAPRRPLDGSLRVLRTGLERARIPGWGQQQQQQQQTGWDSRVEDSKILDEPRRSSSHVSRPTKLYTTRASVEEALKSSRYAALAASGWRVVHPHDHPLPSSRSRNSFTHACPSAPGTTSSTGSTSISAPSPTTGHISISNFNHLTLTLFTHSLNALTPRDFRLALRIGPNHPPNPRP